MQNNNINNTENQNPNIIDPRLRFDAFMANVKDGGLRSVSSIYLLVSYVVARLNHKVSRDTFVQAIDKTMIANHFEISSAIGNLLKSGTIKEDADGMLYMDDAELIDVDLIENDLPLTIRQKSIEACQKVLAKEAYKRENKVSIIETDNGYKVNLKVSDNEIDFMNLELFAASKVQAEMLKDKFITDPVKVYESLIEAIFANE